MAEDPKARDEVIKQLKAELRPKVEAELKAAQAKGLHEEIEKRVRQKIETDLLRTLNGLAPLLDKVMQTISSNISTSADLGEYAAKNPAVVLTNSGKLTWTGLLATIGNVVIGKKLMAMRKPNGEFDGWTAKAPVEVRKDYTPHSLAGRE